jgi:hypothetical protein
VQVDDGYDGLFINDEAEHFLSGGHVAMMGYQAPRGSEALQEGQVVEGPVPDASELLIDI